MLSEVKKTEYLILHFSFSFIKGEETIISYIALFVFLYQGRRKQILTFCFYNRGEESRISYIAFFESEAKKAEYHILHLLSKAKKAECPITPILHFSLTEVYFLRVLM